MSPEINAVDLADLHVNPFQILVGAVYLLPFMAIGGHIKFPWIGWRGAANGDISILYFPCVI